MRLLKKTIYALLGDEGVTPPTFPSPSPGTFPTLTLSLHPSFPPSLSLSPSSHLNQRSMSHHVKPYFNVVLLGPTIAESGQPRQWPIVWIESGRQQHKLAEYVPPTVGPFPKNPAVRRCHTRKRTDQHCLRPIEDCPVRSSRATWQSLLIFEPPVCLLHCLFSLHCS